MRARTWIGWGTAVLLGVLGCGDDPPKKVLKIVEGPEKPEIGWRESPEPVERAPISLTASDGTGLRLVRVEAQTVIEDPLAFTELHLRFNNPEPRRREGRFSIALPPRAAVSRFALRVGDGWQEGEVVERKRAEQVYEDFLHRKQDPALLEKSAGNEFTARVFPIEPNAVKDIILSYSEELERHDDPYRIKLQGLPQIDDIVIDVRVGSNSSTGKESSERARTTAGNLRLSAQAYAPTGDVEVQLPWQRQVALRSGRFVVARVAPKVDAPEAPIEGLCVLFDTSASRALGFGAQIERLGAVIAALRERASKDFALRVIAFDQSSEVIFEGPASGFGMREKAKLLARDALGASDLQQALAFVAEQGGDHARVLFVGDGVVTAGADDTTALREAVAKLAAHGVRRLDALAENGIQDLGMLAALTRAGLPEAGVVIDGRAELPKIVEALWRGTRGRVEVKLVGATWLAPSVLEGVQAGDERLVFAELPEDAPLQIELIGAGAEAPDTLQAPEPLLARAVARAKIDLLTEQLRAAGPGELGAREAKEREIVELSLAQRVVSDYTSLLVLESAADYARFGIEQTALASILRVGDEGIELFDRKQGGEGVQGVLRVAAEPVPEPPADEEQADEGNAQPEEEAPSAEAVQRFGEAAPPRVRTRSAPAGALALRSKDDARSNVDTERRIEDTLHTGGPRQGVAANAPAPATPLPAPKPAAAPSPEPSRPAKAADAVASAAPTSASEAKKARAGAAMDELAGDVAERDAYKETERPHPLAIAAPPLGIEAQAQVRLRIAAGLPTEETRQALRPLGPRAKQCYERGGLQHAPPQRQITLELAVSDKGQVRDAFVSGGAITDPQVRACILAAARQLRFPKPDGANASVDLALTLTTRVVEQAAFEEIPDHVLRPKPAPARPRAAVLVRKPGLDEAYTGALLDVMDALAHGDAPGALAHASAAHARDPGDVIGLVALGEVLETQKDLARAARAYGSIIDLFPSRADLRRMASARLERLAEGGLPLAIDSYRRALAQRSDHPSSHRGLAYALEKQGDHAGAFETLERALDIGFAPDRFEGVDRILREDFALIGAAWIRADASIGDSVRARLAARGLVPDHAPSMRFVLSWETDANDVDFHIHDGRGGHAFYMKPKLPSGGALYADITTGYGPECFAIPGKNRAYPYVLQAHYYARGPMGYGMGRVQVIEHDGQGVLTIAEHPFVIMKDKAFVELARLEKPRSSENASRHIE